LEELKLVPTDDLLEELSLRHDCMIFAASQDKTIASSSNILDTHGPFHACYGLAHGIVDYLRCVSLKEQDEGDETIL
jgi:hypothetical protein